MVRRFVVVTIFGGILFAAPAADACDCVRLKPVTPETRREAPFIFEGTVLEISERSEHTITTTRDGGRSSVRPLDRTVLFDVSAAWNGVSQPRATVLAEMSDCVFPFQVGERYVVFANRHTSGKAETSICTRTTAQKDAAEILRALGPPSYRPGTPR
jgi:hypothetical protein